MLTDIHQQLDFWKKINESCTKNEYVYPTLGPPNDQDVIAKVLPTGKLISEAAGICP
jgi:hypothetical protein